MSLVRCPDCRALFSGTLGLRQHRKHADVCPIVQALAAEGGAAEGEDNEEDEAGEGANGGAAPGDDGAADGGANEAKEGGGVGEGSAPFGDLVHQDFLSLEEIARLPAQRLVPKKLRAQYCCVAARLARALRADPTNERVLRYLFAMPKLCLPRYRGKHWRRAARRNMLVYPNLSDEELERARAWQPRVKEAVCDDLEDRVQRATRAAKAGSLSKASAALFGDPVAPSDDTTLSKMEALHPHEEPPPPVHGALPHAPILEEDSLMRVLSKLPRFSAPGPSGWTYEMIKLICGVEHSFMDDDVRGVDADTQDSRAALVLLCTGMWRGELPLQKWWCACRAIALDKGEGKVRPIAIADAIYRIASRALLNCVDLTEVLPEWQLGVKSRGGCEPAVHLMRRRLNDGFALQTTDIINAFNSASRRKLLEVLAGIPGCSVIMRMTRYAYAEPSDLLFQKLDGTISTISSSSGVRQGDPLSMLLFAIALADVVRESGVLTDFDGVEAVAIVDDLTLVLSPAWVEDNLIERATDLVDRLAAAAAPWGMRLARHKCHLLTQAAMEDLSGTNTLHCEQSYKLLGGFVGEEFAVKDAVAAVYDEWADRTKVLDHLSRQLGLLMLRHVIIAGVGHLARIMPPDAVMDSARHFDREVENTVQRWLDAHSDGHDAASLSEGAAAEQASALLGAPMRFNGLGLRPVAPLAELAYAASLTLSHAVLREKRFDFAIGAGSAEESAICTEAFYLNSTPAELLDLEADHSLLVSLQRKLTTKAATALWGSIWAAEIGSMLMTLETSDTTSAEALEAETRAMLLAEQLGKCSRGWLRALPTTPRLELSDDEVMTGITARLGLAPIAAPQAACPRCGQAIGTDNVALARRHNLVCSHTSLIRTSRHDVVRDTVATALRATHGADNVQIEALLPGDGQQRSDVAWRDHNGRMHQIDVAVVAPTLPPQPTAVGGPDDQLSRLPWPSPAVFDLVAACSTGMPHEIVAPQSELRELQRAKDQEVELWQLHSGESLPIDEAADLLRQEIREATDALAAGLDDGLIPFDVGTLQHAAWSNLRGDDVRLATASDLEESRPELVAAFADARPWMVRAWNEPAATAHRLARLLEEVATSRVIAPKEREKRAKGCVPLVFSARGARAPLTSVAAGGAGDESAAGRVGVGAPEVFWSAMRAADLPALDVCVSCVLLKGATMCDVRMREAHVP